MQIQFNTDNNIRGSEELRAPQEQTISRSLDRFCDRITRLEVHLNDENSHKGGVDRRCMLEARLELPIGYRFAQCGKLCLVGSQRLQPGKTRLQPCYSRVLLRQVFYSCFFPFPKNGVAPWP